MAGNPDGDGSAKKKVGAIDTRKEWQGGRGGLLIGGMLVWSTGKRRKHRARCRKPVCSALVIFDLSIMCAVGMTGFLVYILYNSAGHRRMSSLLSHEGTGMKKSNGGTFES